MSVDEGAWMEKPEAACEGVGGVAVEWRISQIDIVNTGLETTKSIVG
jgi:hypothetical protein